LLALREQRSHQLLALREQQLPELHGQPQSPAARARQPQGASGLEQQLRELQEHLQQGWLVAWLECLALRPSV